MFELRCSIEKEGVLVPLMLRKNPHCDGYETIIAKVNNMSEEKVRDIIKKLERRVESQERKLAKESGK